MTINRLIEYLSEFPKDTRVLINRSEMHALPRYTKVLVNRKTGKIVPPNILKTEPWLASSDENEYVGIIEFK